MDKLSRPAQKVIDQQESLKKAIKASRRRLRTADEEFEAAFKILQKYPNRITFFGSARLTPRTKYYRIARQLASDLSDDGYAIMSGGGGGIMEASDRGAFEDDDIAIGFNIKLPFEQVINPYTTEKLTFNYFFTRKVMMTFYAQAFLVFPGGYGTLDELFEILTLIQTHKMPRVPIFLVGDKFWKPMDKFINKTLLKDGLISKGDEKLYVVTEDIKVMRRIIKKTAIKLD